eukprot:10578818-Alexandrium_andersonii.AAC.1
MHVPKRRSRLEPITPPSRFATARLQSTRVDHTTATFCRSTARDDISSDMNGSVIIAAIPAMAI